jgi:AmmeMemoRadiSam system protein A/AmmeMemoRadiSam system protein B
MVPEVGQESVKDVRQSIDGMAELTRRVLESGAETVVLISPHAPLEADTFVAYAEPTLFGDFTRFRAPQSTFSVSVDLELLHAISKSAVEHDYEVTALQARNLDHGSAVPLYFLLENGWSGKVVALGYSFLSNRDHLLFGSCIREAVAQTERRVAFIASGDLSHRLKPQAPAGYNTDAHLFDEEVVEAFQHNSLNKIVSIDDRLRRLAGECGYRSLLVAIGANENDTPECEVISYEAPFGVGYLVAQISNNIDRRADALASKIPALARKAVETFVNTGEVPEFDSLESRGLSQPSPCFVSLKTREGELRGCIGTIEPSKDSLAEEIVSNAIGAATNDPRFFPVDKDELANLTYSVDILMPAEEAEMNQLDPKIYGVIVESASGEKRGLLLPAIEGVDTPEQQIGIASRKAGITAGESIKIFRFRVQRFPEAPTPNG